MTEFGLNEKFVGLQSHSPEDRGNEEVIYQRGNLFVSLHMIEAVGFHERSEHRPLPVAYRERVVPLGRNRIEKLSQLPRAFVFDALQGIERVLHRVEHP